MVEIDSSDSYNDIIAFIAVTECQIKFMRQIQSHMYG